MKKSLLILLSVLLLGRSATAQVDIPLRPELLEEGDRLMERAETADAFLLKARALREARPFTTEEKDYLVDLGRKLPSDLREKVCPDTERGLCAGETVSLTELSLAGTAAASQGRVPPPPPAAAASSISTVTWVAAGALVILAGAFAFRDKEIQIRR